VNSPWECLSIQKLLLSASRTLYGVIAAMRTARNVCLLPRLGERRGKMYA